MNHVAGCGACHTTRDSGRIGDPERPDASLAGGNVLALQPIRHPVPPQQLVPATQARVDAE